jgi:hypothetical protein
MQKGTRTTRLGVDVHLGGAGAMPSSEQHTATTALMLNILERVHHIRNAAQAGQAAETKSPSAITSSAFHFT